MTEVRVSEPGPSEKSVHFLDDFITEHPTLHPAHRKQIVKRRKEAIPHSVMGSPCISGIMPHGNLPNGKTLDLNQCGEKPVHPFEEFQVPDTFALERAITTPGVADGFSG